MAEPMTESVHPLEALTARLIAVAEDHMASRVQEACLTCNGTGTREVPRTIPIIQRSSFCGCNGERGETCPAHTMSVACEHRAVSAHAVLASVPMMVAEVVRSAMESGNIIDPNDLQGSVGVVLGQLREARAELAELRGRETGQ